MLFVDEFCRFTWMHPMSCKSDVFAILRKYKVLVENLASRKIHNNDRAYLSNQFKKILLNHGTQHRITCPYTSQQNSITIFKHRYIQEIRLTISAKSHLPTCYWLDSFDI